MIVWYLEWLLAPLVWAAVAAFAAVAVGARLSPLGRFVATAAVATVIAQAALLLIEASVRATWNAWRALPGGRLGLEVVGLAIGVSLAIAVNRFRRAAQPSALGPVNRRVLAIGIGSVLVVAAAGYWNWTPVALRPSLSLAREVARARAEDPRGEARSVRSLFWFAFGGGFPLSVAPIELEKRRPGVLGAIVAELRHEVGPDGRPSREGAKPLLGMLAGTGQPLATEELLRWLNWEAADKGLRAAAAVALGPDYAAALAARTWSDPAWRGTRSELAIAAAAASSDSAIRAAMRAVLRASDANSSEASVPFLVVLRSDPVEDRAAALDFFLDDERFGAVSRPLATEVLRKALRPLLSDTLEDEDPRARERACKWLVGDEPQARRWMADLWNEVHGYPCKQLEKPNSRVQVAAAIRRSLGLGDPRPPLPSEARLPPLLHPEREASVQCHIDRFEKHCGDVYAIAVSPDAKLAVVSGGSDNDEATLWDVSTHRLFRTLLGDGGAGIAFGRDRATVLALSAVYGASALDTDTGDRVRKFAPCVRSTATRLAAATKPVLRPRGAGAVSADGSRIVTGGDGMCVWSDDGTLIRRVEICDPGDTIVPVASAFSPDGGTLVAACAHALEWFSVRTGARLGRIATAEQTLIGPVAVIDDARGLRVIAAETPTGQATGEVVLRLWSAGRAGDATSVWAIHLGVQTQSFRFGRDLAASWGQSPPIALSPARDRLLVGGRGLGLWRVDDGQKLRWLEDPANADVTAVTWARDGSVAVAAEREPLRPARPDTPWEPRPARGIRVWDAVQLDAP